MIRPLLRLIAVAAIGLSALTAFAQAPDMPAPVDLSGDTEAVVTIDLTTPPADLWQRIRNGFAMPDLEDRRVAQQQAWLLNRPATLKIALQRSRRYLHHIVEELERRGMPTELALLPVIESSYNPQAYSHARALGMWQFIPSTGKNYNLKQNWWLDERRDILASTSAALDYLQYIYQLSGDWHLALASYNWGEGAVARAVAKNQARGLPTDYLSLKVPEETRYYVPKLQAVKNIIAQAAQFGFDLEPIPNAPYFGTVDVADHLDVRTAADLAGIPLTEFIALNPAYSRPVIPGTGDNPLVLPADKVQHFLDNLRAHAEANKPLSNWQLHTLAPKETLDRVAKRHGIPVARLKQLNGIGKRTKIAAGMTLLIPGRDVVQADTLAAALPRTPEAAPRKPRAVKGKSRVAARSVKPRAVAKAPSGAGQRATKKAARK